MHSHGPVKARHNMVVVGEHRIFLSHLPMFMVPHNAQVILEATFVKQGRTVDDIYFADRAKHRTVLYTLQPESFVLQDFLSAGPAHPALTHFTATVFRGHLEKKGVPIEALTDVEVRVKHIVHAHAFDAPEKLPTLTYVMFGGDQEQFLAHFISKAPDYDQLLSVSMTGQLPSPEELQRGATLEVLDHGTEPSARLKTGKPVSARAHVTGAHQFLNLDVAVKAELYFEAGELSSSM
ncbi:MAG: hypothetical protein ABJA98_13055 [Acidobacteriota bacterium]